MGIGSAACAFHQGVVKFHGWALGRCFTMGEGREHRWESMGVGPVGKGRDAAITWELLTWQLRGKEICVDR